MLLLLDNYDSFTYNLAQYFLELGEEVRIFRNDKITVDEIREMAPDRIVISPGPKTPDEAGISKELVRALSGSVPILGVCLGHQAMSAAYGGRIVKAERLMHGKTSLVEHDGKGVFKGVENPFNATRYHSLVVDQATLPDMFIVTARDPKGEIMGIRHRSDPTEGVQFHPESIICEHGKELLKNFLDY